MSLWWVSVEKNINTILFSGKLYFFYTLTRQTICENDHLKYIKKLVMNGAKVENVVSVYSS